MTPTNFVSESGRTLLKIVWAQAEMGDELVPMSQVAQMITDAINAQEKFVRIGAILRIPVSVREQDHDASIFDIEVPGEVDEYSQAFLELFKTANIPEDRVEVSVTDEEEILANPIEDFNWSGTSKVMQLDFKAADEFTPTATGNKSIRITLTAPDGAEYNLLGSIEITVSVNYPS